MTTETTTIAPWRSCFIAFPTLRQACDAIVALYENDSIVKHHVQGIFTPDGIPPSTTQFEVFFAIACTDEIDNTGYGGEADFIAAAAKCGGEYTGS